MSRQRRPAVLFTMVRFELLRLLRDRAFGLLAVVLVGAVALGVANGAAWVRFQEGALATLRVDAERKLEAARAEAAAILQGEKPAPRGWWSNPADARGFAYYLLTSYATKPPALLAVLTVGQADLLPYYFKVGPGPRSGSLVSYELENPRRLLLGRFDLAFVVVVLVPLVLLAAGYNALAAERESGRLPLVVLHGATPLRLTLVRLGLRAGVLALLAGAAVLVSLLIAGFDFTAPGAPAALLAWLAVAAAYGAFWLAATLVSIALTRHSAASALMLASLWLGLVVVAPWALSLIAGTVFPLPSRVDYVLEQRAAGDDAEAGGSALLARFLEDHPELASQATAAEITDYTTARIVATEYVEQRLRPLQAEFEGQLLRQQSLIDRWQWLSPAVLAQQAFNELAGAGRSRHRAFLTQVDGYIDALRAYFTPIVLSGQYEFRGFDEWPRFTWREPPRDVVAARMRAAWAGHLVPALLLTLFAGAVLGRRPPL